MNKQSLDSDQWVDRYGDILYRYTLVRVNHPDTAEEIVQITFLAALEAQKSFEGRASEKSWLFGILKHKILDHYRGLKKQKTFDFLPEDDSDTYDYLPDGHWKAMPTDWKIDPEKAAENSQLVKALAECLDKLPEKFRRIFVLREIEGLGSEKICNEFNVKPTNLWVILHRARSQLRKCLETSWINKV
ncbi:hypothetical protein UR09_00195 [Candidatus Nitromaritima sp. SCGC AAA799-A02]|nr:hypothetical protein UZ36_00190 [Candidatus Nitromaritima sp. SCGC AAA799-C22]KMP12740.1 hypothetical protein UR09_00195 [Candidatus Nitromaritima sp. SCGC AAA799-A02]